MDDLRDERSDAQVVAGDEAPLADDRCAGAVRSSQIERVTYFQSAALKSLITLVWDERFGVVGVRKVWHQLLCDDVKIACCTVGRLMEAMGVESVRCGFCIERDCLVVDGLSHSIAAGPFSSSAGRFDFCQLDLGRARGEYLSDWINEADGGERT